MGLLVRPPCRKQGQPSAPCPMNPRAARAARRCPGAAVDTTSERPSSAPRGRLGRRGHQIRVAESPRRRREDSSSPPGRPISTPSPRPHPRAQTLLRKLKRSDNEARILVLGLDNSGKTTILKKLSEEDISHIMPTQGFNIKSLMQDGFKLNVWDIGGQKSIRPYRPAWTSNLTAARHCDCVCSMAWKCHAIDATLCMYWRNYFDQTDALVYVIDAADHRRMEETSMELGQLVDEAKLADIPVLVYGNKSDLMNAMEQCEIEESVAPVLKGRNYFVVECSAKTGKGLQDGMEWLVDQINKGE